MARATAMPAQQTHNAASSVECDCHPAPIADPARDETRRQKG
jgi:hypothetical protein